MLRDNTFINEDELDFALSSILTSAIDIDCPKSNDASMVTPAVLRVIIPAISGGVLGASDDINVDLYTGASSTNVSTLLVSSVLSVDSDGTADTTEARYSVLLTDLQSTLDQYVQAKVSTASRTNISSVITTELGF